MLPKLLSPAKKAKTQLYELTKFLRSNASHALISAQQSASAITSRKISDERRPLLIKANWLGQKFFGRFYGLGRLQL